MPKRTKSQVYAASVKADRDAWAREQEQRCMICDCKAKWPGLQVHEIERKSHAPERWGHRSNYLLVCEPCHAGPLATMPHAEQLMWKMRTDPSNYDLRAWLMLRDPFLKAPNRVTQYEVDAVDILIDD